MVIQIGLCAGLIIIWTLPNMSGLYSRKLQTHFISNPIRSHILMYATIHTIFSTHEIPVVCQPTKYVLFIHLL